MRRASGIKPFIFIPIFIFIFIFILFYRKHYFIFILFLFYFIFIILFYFIFSYFYFLFIYFFLFYFFYQKECVSTFLRFLNFIKNEDIIENYKKRYRMNINHLEAVSKSHGEFYVKHKPDLAQKYLGKFVTWLQVEESDDFQIINKNQSVRILCNNECVGAVIRDIAKKMLWKTLAVK